MFAHAVKGTGKVRDNESLSLSILRLIEEEALKENTKQSTHYRCRYKLRLTYLTKNVKLFIASKTP